MPEQRPLAITATIDGRAVPRSAVLAWEAQRAARVAKKLDVERPGDDLDALRDALVARKLELGHVELERRLRREIALTGRASRLVTALSRGCSRADEMLGQVASWGRAMREVRREGAMVGS